MTPQTLSSKGNLHHPGPQEVVNPLQGHRYADAVVVIVVVVLHLGDLLGQRRRFAPTASHLHFKASGEFFETSVDVCAYLIDRVAGLGSVLYCTACA
ncbi:hypothetical protein F2Q69_00061239 [Brassica cretica]|uniref:Uncharacterized protein n=1 Tax=Brassica cretica TaxID=69181 RepID=A0A8S9RKL3_BRACR|nr:hypothetical protein F2Q69_00061239 [Brassica cretica]